MPKKNELVISRTDQVFNINNCTLDVKTISRIAEVSYQTTKDYATGLEIDDKDRIAIEKVIRKSPKISELNDAFAKLGDHSMALKNAMISEIFKGLMIAGDDFVQAIADSASDPKLVQQLLRSIATLLPKEVSVEADISLKNVIENITIEAEVEEEQDIDEEAEVRRSIAIG